MIAGLDILNFKRFAQISLNLSPLTVLSGHNGGGKSTILQALVLLRQAAVDSARLNSIPLNGAYGLELGEAAGVLNVNADTPVIEFGLTPAGKSRSNWRFTYGDDRSLYL